MKKLISTLTVALFVLSLNGFAQEQEPVKKDKKAKTEKTTAVKEEKSCSKDTKKGSCCASKKEAKS